jgi:uncharacterized protein
MPFAIDIERIAGETGASMSVDLCWTPDGMDLGRAGVVVRGEVCFKGSVSNAGDTYVLAGDMIAEYEAECDRCLGSFKKKLDMPITRVFVQADGDLHDYDEADVEALQGTIIDLAPHIREEIVLSMPIRLLCKEGCKGICPDCGIDLNTGECICGKSH